MVNPIWTSIDSSIRVYSYTYGSSGSIVGFHTTMTLPGGSTSYSYDALNRLTSRTSSKTSGTLYTRSYSYTSGSGSNTTTLVSKVQNGSYGTYNYTYDAVGNITAVSGGQSASYTYDAKNQLISETRGGTTYSYAYDGAGNLTSRTKLTGSGTNTYTYGNSQWKDLLTKYYKMTANYSKQFIKPTLLGIARGYAGRMIAEDLLK